MTKLLNRYSVAAVVLVVAAPAWGSETALNMAANIELDSDAITTSETDTAYGQGGRVLGEFSGEHTRGQAFVRGVGQVLLRTDGTTGVDDAYIQFGDSTWDLQAGRFEAWDIVTLGKDTLVLHAAGVDVYRGNDTRGRIGDNGGQFALHFNPSDRMSFELATIYGDAPAGADNTTAFSGVRPAALFRLGAVDLIIGAEHVAYTNGTETDYNGAGARVALSVGPAHINIGAAAKDGEMDGVDGKVMSALVNATIGDLGLGYVHSRNEFDDSDLEPSVNTFYAAYTVPVMGFDRATATFAVVHSIADEPDADRDGIEDEDDSTTGARLRFNYAF